MDHLFNWVEIPVKDMDRAKLFYAKVLETELSDMAYGDDPYAVFNCEDPYNAGALAQGTYYIPSPEGVLIYLNGGDDLTMALSRVEAAGGNVIMAKTYVSDQVGCIAMFIDSEGNRVGLHSSK